MDRREPRRWFAPTIQNKLLVVMLVVALTPLLLFGALAYFKSRETVINQVGERLQAASLLAMSQIDQTFAFSQENIRSWAALDAFQMVERGDPEGEVSHMLSDYLEAYGVYNTLVAVDVDGEVVAASDQDLLGISVKETGWYRRVMESGRPDMAPLRFDPELGGYGVSLSVPIVRKYSDNRIIGVLRASVDWRELLEQVNAIDMVPGGQSPDGFAVLIDHEGYILAAPDFILFSDEANGPKSDYMRVYDKRWWVAENPFLLERLLTRPSHRYTRHGGEELLLVNMPAAEFRYIGKTGWSLVLVRDAEDALQSIEFIRERAFLIGLGVVVLIVIVAYVMSRQMGSPITRLTKWAEQLSHGNLDSDISLRSNDELSRLASSLDNMRQNLKNYLDQLFESRERYQSIISSIDCVVWEARLNPPSVTLLSGQVDHVTGRSPEQLLEQIAQWRRFVHPDHHQALMDAWRKSIEKASDTYVEFKFRHGDGHWIWMKALTSVVIDELSVTGLRGVVVDINDVVVAKEEMAEARDIAIKTAQDKSRFLATVSHEIRTPIHGMLGMLELLNEDRADSSERQTLDMAKRSGRSLMALVDDVLNFSRIESGELEFTYQSCDVHDLFNTAVSLVAVDAYERGLDIGVVVEASFPGRVELDAIKVNQVLTNLLSNALKFTSHGSILLWCEMLLPNRLYVEVKDSGVGIEARRQKDLFQPFVQADGSDTWQFGGSGLGLALCERLVKGMGGKIGVKSIAGVGSSFYFELPVELSPDPSPPIPVAVEFRRRFPASSLLLIGDLPATSMVLKMACQQWGIGFHWEAKENRILRNLEEVLEQQNFRWILVAQDISDRFWEKLKPYLGRADAAHIIQLRVPTERYGQRPLPHLYLPFSLPVLARRLLGGEPELPDLEQAGQHQGGQRLPKVLVVDDNEVNRRVACGYLRKLGFSCDIAEDGVQALDAVKSQSYGMVFMDCQMPVMDGYQATAAIREHLQGQSLPIIALTANAMEGDREKCLTAGMDDYLAKPLRKDKLQEVVERWLPQNAPGHHGNTPSA